MRPFCYFSHPAACTYELSFLTPKKENKGRTFSCDAGQRGWVRMHQTSSSFVVHIVGNRVKRPHVPIGLPPLTDENGRRVFINGTGREAGRRPMRDGLREFTSHPSCDTEALRELVYGMQ